MATCSKRTPTGRGYRGVNWRNCGCEATCRVFAVLADGREIDHTEHTGPLCERHAREWAGRFAGRGRVEVRTYAD